MIIDRLSVFVKWKFWKQLKKDSPQKEAAKKMKNRKNNWIKIVIQLLSFILIPELFVTGFTAIGDIFSQIYAGSISWESVRYSVYVLIATVPGSVLDFSAALELCRISCGLQRGSWEKAAGGGTEIQKYTRKLTEF